MDNLRRFLLVFVVAIFLTLSVSGAVLAVKYNDSYITKIQKVDVDAAVYDPNKANPSLLEPFKDNILIIIGDKGNSETELVILANVNTEKSIMSFMFIPEDFKYETNERAGELLKDIGAAEAADSLSSFFNTTIDYYLHLSSKNFVKMVNALDFDDTGIEYEIPCDMTYKSGSYKIDLDKGVQKLDGDKALQLIQFYRTKNNTYPASMLEFYDGSKIKRIEASQRFFEELFKQKILIDKKDYSEVFVERLMPVIEDCDTNLEKLQITKFGNLLKEIPSNSIRYFVAGGDNTVIDNASFVYNNKVLCLPSGDVRNGESVWEEYFITD